jgi:HEXXH motif-containing protein
MELSMARRRVDPPVDLTFPAEGSATARALLSASLGEAMAVALGLPSPRGLDPLDPLVAFDHKVRPLLAAERGLLAAALLQPSRLTLARCLAFSPEAPLASRLAWQRELASLLALDAAEAGKLPAATFRLTTPLVSERRGLLFEAPRGAVVRLGPRQMEVITAGGAAAVVPHDADLAAAAGALGAIGGAASAAQIELGGGAQLVLHDRNPFALLEAHPDKSGNAVDLGGHPPEEWAAALDQARSVIDGALPEIAAEMRLFLRHIVPVGYFAERHLSASFLEAIGVIYLSLHPHTMTLVEATVHEFQHNKLNLLLGLDPVLENADAPLFTSPVRPDPRPLRGVLLAVHAFQPIVLLYDRLCADASRPDHAWLVRRRGELARVCHEGCQVLLPNGRPTPVGQPLIDELRRFDQDFAPWCAA